MKRKTEKGRSLVSTDPCDRKGGWERRWIRTACRLRPPPLHDKHSRVLRGDDANEFGHSHQTIDPPNRLGSLLGPSEVIRYSLDTSLEGLKDKLPVLLGPAQRPLGRDDRSTEADVDRLEDVVVRHEEVGK